MGYGLEGSARKFFEILLGRKLERFQLSENSDVIYGPIGLFLQS
jgi:hypothetical protein